MLLGNLNLFFEDSNPVCRKPEVLKFNLRDLNPFFENSNSLTVLSIKSFDFSKVTVLFSKHIFALFSNLSQIQSNSTFKLKFFQNLHSYTLHNIIFHHFILQKPKVSHESIIIQSIQNEINSLRSLKEMGKGQSSQESPAKR